jgi:hypothetical protein
MLPEEKLGCPNGFPPSVTTCAGYDPEAADAGNGDIVTGGPPEDEVSTGSPLDAGNGNIVTGGPPEDEVSTGGPPDAGNGDIVTGGPPEDEFSTGGPPDEVSTGDICTTNNVPTSGERSVQLACYENDLGGNEGDDCPSSCFGDPIMEQWYAIAEEDDNQCFQWPGGQWPGESGANSMVGGVCGLDSSSFMYNEWDNCDCSGTAHPKEVFVDRCVVNDPPTMCIRIVDFSECAKEVIVEEISELEKELGELLGELGELEDTSPGSRASAGRAVGVWAVFAWLAAA